MPKMMQPYCELSRLAPKPLKLRGNLRCFDAFFFDEFKACKFVGLGNTDFLSF